MNHIIRNAEKNEDVSITLDSISNAAVAASYGNSGTIFAKYLYGLSLVNQNKKLISIKEFTEGLHKAVSYAYDSIASPKEGTILTHMKEWTNYLNKHEDKHNEFENLLESSIDYSYNVLDKTKDLLEVLKEADVVDAGAKGFVCFVEGILDQIRFGKGKKNTVSRIEHVDFNKIDHLSGEMKYKYCSEFTLEDIDVRRRELIKTLNDHGDSVIVNLYKDKAKVHIHTNEPEKVMLKLIKVGKVVESKVDDMSIQYDIVHKKRNKIGLITDSIADIPKDLIKDNMITVIPIQVLSEGTVYLDRITIDGDTIYEILDNSENYPTTSQPSETNIERTLEFLLNYYEKIVGVFVSDKMSGTFSKVTKVAEKLAVKLEKITGKPPLYIENVSAVVSAFIGKGAYAVAYREE